ncbi:hypothetical protein L484_004207 [Morus notabilis]|uniref:Uncharacterized protein n=1 Tax=Morus notabilis TaxID=981085 RepID=W9R5K1_9ROSA|nr:DELLA protein RGL1 [Morus notabilis]EXB71072.1 hypothetical protein L484_004207 [Morus notabilis]
MSFNSDLQNSMFSSEDFNFQEIQDPQISSIHTMEEMNNNQVHFYGDEDWGDFGVNPSFSFDYGYNQDENLAGEFFSSKYHSQDQHQQSNSVHEMLGDPEYDVGPPSLEACLEEISTKIGDETNPNAAQHVGVKKSKEYPFSLAALELLNSYGSGFKRLKGQRIIEPINHGNHSNSFTEVVAADRKFSTEEILRIAGARFIQSYSQQENYNHPFEWSFSGLSNEEIKDVELVELLLASAEKVESQQYESASRLVNLCDHLSSNTGNPVQRVVYYFCEGLKEKIDRETGRIGGVSSKGLGKSHKLFDIDNTSLVPCMPTIALHQGQPLFRAEKVAAVQAIVESIGEAKKVHVIDLRIAFGMQWTAVMEVLASRRENPIELLKITAIAGTTAPRHVIEEAGRWLENFASNMKIPFSFKVVMMEDVLSLKEDLFELDTEETLAVYSSYGLRSLISQPTQLESLMRVIRSLNPCVMVVNEVEANHNCPAFVNRFIEALFFYGTFFDCLEASLKHDDTNRLIFESLYCGRSISNLVAAEGEERKIRHVKIHVWRAFFARFGMEELELSPSSIQQAKMALKNFPCGSSCTLDMSGKCLMMGWKGTPLSSLSAWKYL